MSISYVVILNSLSSQPCVKQAVLLVTDLLYIGASTMGLCNKLGFLYCDTIRVAIVTGT